MRSFRNLSVKWKLTWIIMIASVTPLLLCCGAFIAYEVISFRRTMVRELSSQAEIIASNNFGNLRFHALGMDTRDDAEQSLQSLRPNEQIVSAGIYEADGKLLARYARNADPDEFPVGLMQDKHYFTSDYLVMFKPIVQDLDSLGTVYIKSDLSEMYDRITQYTGIVALFLFGSFVVTFSLAAVLQRVVSGPILQLAETMGVVTDRKDYSIRAKKEANDEVGRLIDGFNDMLTQIQKRDEDLQKTTEVLQVTNEKLEDYSRNLEEKVSQRTQELSVKNQSLEETLQKVKQMQDQIVMQEKLASLGTLTAGIAHEIKNPLNFVNNFSALSIGLTEELRENLEKEKDKFETETQKEITDILAYLEQNVHKINEHGKRADSIVRNMLLHSRGKAGQRQAVNVNDLLNEYVGLAYHGMRAKDSSFNIEIRKELQESIEPIEVVPQDLGRVFLNILNNACYAAYEKKIETNSDFSPILTISTKNLDKHVEIRIRDNGKGIRKEDLDRIFTPFFSTKPTGQGTGLGLSISYDIIVQHKGKITVDTEEGQYTEFVISLPKIRNDKARAA